MLQHNRGEAYIRRASPKDKGVSLSTALNMEYQKLKGQQRRKVPYVLVRRGFPNEVIMAAATKAEIRASISGSGHTFRSACRFFRCG